MDMNNENIIVDPTSLELQGKCPSLFYSAHFFITAVVDWEFSSSFFFALDYSTLQIDTKDGEFARRVHHYCNEIKAKFPAAIFGGILIGFPFYCILLM